MLEQYLKELGLNDKEIAVYLCVMEYQKITPSRVATLTKINRTTVYSVAKELVKKGIVAEEVGADATYLVALAPSELSAITRKAKEELKTQEQLVTQSVELLSSLGQSKTYSVPKVRFIQDRNVKDFLYQQLPVWAESSLKNDPNWWGFQDHSLVELFPDWIEWHWQTLPAEIGARLLTNDAAAEHEVRSKNLSDKRQTKFLTDNTEFTGTTAVLGDYIVFIMTRERPYYIVEIHDSVMAHNMREVFKRLWEHS